MDGSKNVPDLQIPPPRLLARLTSPAGPSAFADLSGCGARVVVVPGRYSNMTIVAGKSALMVADVGSAGDVDLIVRASDWLEKPVKHIFPTHLHFDHIMGIEAASRRTGASVAMGESMHRLVSSGMKSRTPIKKTLWNFFIPYVWQGLPGPPREDFPGGFRWGFPWSRNAFSSIGPSLTEGAPIDGFDGWTAIETPGHTDECCSLFHSGSGFFISGDTVRNYLGGEWNPIVTDFGKYRLTVEKLKTLDIRVILPGHGPVIKGGNLAAKLSRHHP